MKAILKFNLDDLDDRYNFTRTTKSLDMYLALYNIQQRMAATINDGADPMSPDEFREILSDNDIHMDELGI